MKTTNYQKLRDAELAKMTSDERALYDDAYAKAGLTMRMAQLFYDARTAAGLTQAELARRMHTTQPTIAALEGGGRLPTLDMLERLAQATGHSLEIRLSA
ncbi:helix-turn-helix domain-containing protein [Nocardia wallacei]|uniref:helix-turn-helix domain-containing protein n=1 Tax=Nocardia wallacei TaxID=480035 RepID=UPI002457671C|nr:helix-turn-helix transcriptional regulator [Nocardia wallacei]